MEVDEMRGNENITNDVLIPMVQSAYNRNMLHKGQFEILTVTEIKRTCTCAKALVYSIKMNCNELRRPRMSTAQWQTHIHKKKVYLSPSKATATTRGILRCDLYFLTAYSAVFNVRPSLYALIYRLALLENFRMVVRSTEASAAGTVRFSPSVV